MSGIKIVLAVLVIGAAWAQERQVVVQGHGDVLMSSAQAVELQVTADKISAVQGGPGGTFEFVSVMHLDNKVVKGSPYSAEAVNETIQTLADGNRISRKNTSTIYRDSQGRTRREQTIAVIGPWSAEGQPPQMISISDPVAGTNYTLDPAKRVARKGPTFFNMRVPAPEGAIGVAGKREQVRIVTRHAEGVPGPITEDVIGYAPEMAVSHSATSAAAPKTESLGTRNIEGVQAEGSRTTMTIPVGEIGNERPIDIVSERWYSPELQTVVMTRRMDPRFGETIYKLTRINRTEPPANLFQVPADFTVQDEPNLKFLREKVEK